MKPLLADGVTEARVVMARVVVHAVAHMKALKLREGALGGHSLVNDIVPVLFGDGQLTAPNG